MERIVELRSGAIVAQRHRELTSIIAMMIALGSWTMMFGALFMVYVGLRAQALSWPPPGLQLPFVLPAASTAAILLSSYTLSSALHQLRLGSRLQAVRLIGVTFALGWVFVGLQTLLWRGLWLDGITTATGALGTVVYGLTVLHAIHVVAGLGVLGWLLLFAIRGGQIDRRVLTLRLCGMFWHFVDAVWVLMFVGMFLL